MDELVALGLPGDLAGVFDWMLGALLAGVALGVLTVALAAALARR